MADHETEMDLDNVSETITASQEDVLLHGDNPELPENAALPHVEVESTNQAASANLSTLKNLIESNVMAGAAELSMSLQTGVVTVSRPSPPRARSRSTQSRNKARRTAKSNVNPHDRIKNDQEAGTPKKRGRVSGGTPPSATQPSKKPLCQPNETISGQNPQKLSRSQKKNLKKKMKNENRSSSSIQTAGQQTPVDVTDPPMAPVPKLSGSNTTAPVTVQHNDSDTTNVESTASVPNPMVVDDGELPQSYAQVADSHCMAIIDQRAPGQMQLLDQSRSDKINTLLTDTIMSMIGTEVELPAFDDTRLHGGAMRIRCANTYSRKWLETNVSKLDAKKLWPGAKMVVIDFKDIPKPHKFNVFFRGITKSSKDILCLLEKQNKGITTKSWSVLHCGRKDGGTYMTIGVGQDSFETLRTHANTLYCGMGKATFTAVKSCKENKAMTHPVSKEKSADVQKTAVQGTTQPHKGDSAKAGTSASLE